VALKGFYFSFDALLALTVMAASLFVVAQVGSNTDTFSASNIEYRQVSAAAKDAVTLGSEQTLSSLNSSFRSKLIDDTVVEQDNVDDTVIDNLALLWAARNFSYAEELSKTYFGEKLEDYEYRVTVTEGDTTSEIYSTSPVPENASLRSVASRLVSGHRIDRPSEGFRSRARAVKVRRNTTKIFSIPAMGNAYKNGKMEVRKEFHLENVDRIWNATLYFDVEYNSGQSVEQLRVNNDQAKNDIEILHDNGDTLYGVVNIREYVEEGENSLYIRLKGENQQSEPNEFQPGSFIEVKYRQDGNQPIKDELRHRRIFFEDIEARNPGSSQAGIFKVESFDLPREADFVNASLKINASGLDKPFYFLGVPFRDCGHAAQGIDRWDVRLIFNGEKLTEECHAGTFTRQYELDESLVKNGTNVLVAYLENYGNTFWGGDEVSLNSDFETEDSSHIDLWYRRTGDSLEFGRIDVKEAEKMGGGIENPKLYDKEFEYSELQSTEVYVAQKYSNEVDLGVDDGTGYETVFSSPGFRATPTRISAPPRLYSTENENTVRLEDIEDGVKFYPESRFLWTVSVPSQVGYGELYDSRSEAVEDARQRLQDTLGSFVDATNIQSDAISTGDQPYLWGPARVRVEVWRR
jgi:hypothetical protein